MDAISKINLIKDNVDFLSVEDQRKILDILNAGSKNHIKKDDNRKIKYTANEAKKTYTRITKNLQKVIGSVSFYEGSKYTLFNIREGDKIKQLITKNEYDVFIYNLPNWIINSFQTLEIERSNIVWKKDNATKIEMIEAQRSLLISEVIILFFEAFPKLEKYKIQ